MSAQLDDFRHAARYRRMTSDDLDAVAAAEARIYPHPWTRGNFSDSLNADYQCWVMGMAGAIAGYTVMMCGAGEAHLLNLSIADGWQRRGLGSSLLAYAMQLAREAHAARILLEVRVSNIAARGLYAKNAFREIALRLGYYPAHEGREDAVIMAREL